MDQISNLLSSEITKYKDIFNILSKLQEDGEVKKISELFYKLFMNESKYTIQELMKIQKEKNERININKQYEANLSLFHINLYLVVKHIIESTFKVVVKENQDMLKSQNSEYKLFDDTEINISQDNQLLKEKERASTTKYSLELSDVQPKMTLKNKKSKPIERKATKYDTHLSPSKMTSSLQNIINPSSIPSKNIKSITSSKDIDKSKSTTKSLQHSILSKRSSMQVSSNKSIITSLKLPINSEFNYITGSATFSQTERKFWDLPMLGPGPAYYDGDNSTSSKIRRSVSPTIGNSPKRSWIDVLSYSNPSPGPGGLYPSHHFISK